MKRVIFALALAVALTSAANAAPKYVTYQADTEAALAIQPSSTDLIEGMTPEPLSGGWHPANTNLADHQAAFTDGKLMSASGLSGLLNDFPGDGVPALSIQYDLASPADIAMINVFSGNHYDGRSYHTYTVEFSTDGAFTWSTPVYVQSHPSGYVNAQGTNGFQRAATSLFDDSGSALAMGVTNLRFNLFSTSNTGAWMWDPYTGVNPFTGVDDGFACAFESPLILEIDVVPVPEPGTLAVMASSLLGMGAILRRKRA